MTSMRGAGQIDREQGRRIVELMALAAWADGRVVGSEALVIHKLVTATPELRDVGTTGEISRAVKDKLDALGLEQAVREVASDVHDTLHRELAYRCCAKVCGADGEFVVPEAKVLSLLQQIFGLSQGDAERLLVLATR